MKLLNIKTYPDKILAKKADLVTIIDNNIQNLIENMAYTMFKSEGIGLAAPQIGISKKIIIYSTNYHNNNNDYKLIINPKIINKCNPIISKNEGCLSAPYLRVNVKRYNIIKITGIDRNETPIEIFAKELESIILQHEIDHLNGIMITDHISYLKKQMYKKKIIKNLKSKG